MIMVDKSHIAKLLYEIGLYNKLYGSFKLTSHFEVIAQPHIGKMRRSPHRVDGLQRWSCVLNLTLLNY
jgi:hypothetical protein